MTRPISVQFDAAALRHNLDTVRWYAPRAKVLAVVKANAYGHGLLRTARALANADGFAVLDLNAAVTLRDLDYRQPIVMLEGFFDEGELALIHQHRILPVVHSPEQLALLERTRSPRPAGVHLKIDTGMNRLGFEPEDVVAVLERLARIGIDDVTLMTHFACADDPDGVVVQLGRFDAATAGLAHPRSLANSAAILRHPATHAEWVRPGIMLYGASPCADLPAASFGLVPVMTFASQLTAVRELTAGEAVGYGATFVAPEAMRMGVVACGYADGYPRHAPSGTPILVDGVRTTTIGRVSMCMLCVDLRAVPGAQVGSPVVLWGAGLPVDEVARAAGTIGYELLCAVAPRVPIREI